MHLVHDENGNLIPHSEHAHGEEKSNKTQALLSYMLEHNQHHAEELEEVAKSLEKDGFTEAAKEIQAGVKAFQEGNAHLKHALERTK